jgi:hypothetical protein
VSLTTHQLLWFCVKYYLSSINGTLGGTNVVFIHVARKEEVNLAPSEKNKTTFNINDVTPTYRRSDSTTLGLNVGAGEHYLSQLIG